MDHNGKIETLTDEPAPYPHIVDGEKRLPGEAADARHLRRAVQRDVSASELQSYSLQHFAFRKPLPDVMLPEWIRNEHTKYREHLAAADGEHNRALLLHVAEWRQRRGGKLAKQVFSLARALFGVCEANPTAQQLEAMRAECDSARLQK